MPFYTWLRPRPGDDADTLKTKQRAAQKIKALRAALKAHIHTADLPDNMELPYDTPKFVRIATWNIREFDSSSYGYRSQEAKAYIPEILSHFDLIALQEIRRLTALLADRAKSDNDSDADAYFIALGDFNIVRPDHGTMEALLTNEFTIPEPLRNVPGSNLKQNKF